MIVLDILLGRVLGGSMIGEGDRSSLFSLADEAAFCKVF